MLRREVSPVAPRYVEGVALRYVEVRCVALRRDALRSGPARCVGDRPARQVLSMSRQSGPVLLIRSEFFLLFNWRSTVRI